MNIDTLDEINIIFSNTKCDHCKLRGKIFFDSFSFWQLFLRKVQFQCCIILKHIIKFRATIKEKIDLISLEEFHNHSAIMETKLFIQNSSNHPLHSHVSQRMVNFRRKVTFDQRKRYSILGCRFIDLFRKKTVTWK